MAIEYHRIPVNTALLEGGDVEQAKQGVASDNIPFEGTLEGIRFIPYSDCKCKDGSPEYQHTEIRIEDTTGRPLTGVTDIRDYLSENWAKKGYKQIGLPVKRNERINIIYSTKAGNPIVGEFVFIVQSENIIPPCDI